MLKESHAGRKHLRGGETGIRCLDGNLLSICRPMSPVPSLKHSDLGPQEAGSVSVGRCQAASSWLGQCASSTRRDHGVEGPGRERQGGLAGSPQLSGDTREASISCGSGSGAQGSGGGGRSGRPPSGDEARAKPAWGDAKQHLLLGATTPPAEASPPLRTVSEACSELGREE